MKIISDDGSGPTRFRYQDEEDESSPLYFKEGCGFEETDFENPEDIPLDVLKFEMGFREAEFFMFAVKKGLDLNRDRTGRGFSRIDFTDRNGEECSVQMSSVATEDCIWLGVDEPTPTILTSENGWVDIPLPKGAFLTGRMHLSRDQVEDLLPILQEFVETGEM